MESDGWWSDGAGGIGGDIQPRCPTRTEHGRCNALLAEFVTRPWRIRCRRCKTLIVVEPTDGPLNDLREGAVTP